MPSAHWSRRVAAFDFHDPEGKPFFAGTYFPKKGRMGISGFVEIIEHIAALWKKDQKRIKISGEMITNAIQLSSPAKAENTTVDETTLKLGFDQLAHSFEPMWAVLAQPRSFLFRIT